jgi:hypothetical protein
MSALRMIACEMVDLHEMTIDQRKRLQQAARFEAHARGYWISGCSSTNCCMPETRGGNPFANNYINKFKVEHKLTRWNKKLFRNARRPGISDRSRPIGEGSFVECCACLVALITPPNPTE